MDTYVIEDPNVSFLGLLNELKSKGVVTFTLSVAVTILGNGQVKEVEKPVMLAPVFVDGKKVRKGFTIEFVCPKCRKHQKKSKDSDLCWRCQKVVDAHDLFHGPVDASQIKEGNPLFAPSAGVRVISDGHINARKLG